MITCMALDDESLALDVIEDYVARLSFLELKYKSTNALDVIGLLHKQAIDLLFLDIQMPDIMGHALMKSLENPPLVIFTTAYPDYAVEGFDLEAVDYLLKPFTFERFAKAVGKARKRLATEEANGTARPRDYIIVKTGYESIKINVNDILFIEGYRDYLRIHTRHKKLMTLMTMPDMLDKLPAGEFVRIHRSYIISIKHLETVLPKKVTVGGKELPIGNSYKKSFFQLIGR